MNWEAARHAGIAFAAALFIASFLKYAVHRMMHVGKILHKKHALHHQAGEGQGWLGEFVDYFLPAPLVLWPAFFISLWAGIGFAVGAVLYAAMSAYAHQVQHEQPELVFWLPRPVHHLHHEHRMWKHNFGILTDFWDRVFGTYKKVDWKPDGPPPRFPIRRYFTIKWF